MTRWLELSGLFVCRLHKLQDLRVCYINIIVTVSLTVTPFSDILKLSYYVLI